MILRRGHVMVQHRVQQAPGKANGSAVQDVSDLSGSTSNSGLTTYSYFSELELRSNSGNGLGHRNLPPALG